MISEMPDDILHFILSLMPIRAAARTSILSRRWKYLWKTSVVFSSSLNLDVLAMSGSNYPEDTFPIIFPRYRNIESIGGSRVLLIERNKFVEWVNLILQLDYPLVIDSFRLRCYLRRDSTHLIDQWVNVALAKRVPNIDIDLSHIDTCGNLDPYEELYVFPSELFTQETGLFVKHLCLNACILGALDVSCFRSIVDLQLENVLIDQENFVSFLPHCPNLEKLSFVECRRLRRLRISGPFLKLKYLRIADCVSLREIEIDARSLTQFVYQGNRANFSFVNVPKLSNVIVNLFSMTFSVSISDFLAKLSIHLPKLESLLLQFLPQLGNVIPTLLLTKLRKLVLLISMDKGTCWKYTPLLKASPHLQRLELHWWYRSEAQVDEGVSWSCDLLLLHLKEIMLSGFTGTSHEIEFGRYLLNNSPVLKNMTIMGYRTKWYGHEQGFYNMEAFIRGERAEVAERKKKMEERVSGQFTDVLRPGVELKFV